jgi:hypothetical protein
VRAASTQFRRFVASLMLVAMASFGLHNGAFAGLHRHGSAQIECGAGHSHGHAHASHGPAPSLDVHKAPHHHHGPSVDLPDPPAEPASTGFDGSCCTGGCPVAVTAPVPHAIPTRIAALMRHGSEPQAPAATTLDGLKRPPRPLGIA